MEFAWLDPLVFPLACLGGGGALLALWLGAAPRRVNAVAVAGHLVVGGVALFAGTFAVLAAAAGLSLPVWGSAGALAGLYVLLVVIPSPPLCWLATTAVEMSRQRRA